jgi:hypothetical protein
VLAENGTSSNLFDNDASINDGQFVYTVIYDGSSDEEAVEYSMDKFGETVGVINAEKTIFIDAVVVLVAFIICLLMWSICYFKFIIQEGREIIFRCRNKWKWKEKVSNLRDKRKDVKNLNIVTRRIIMRERKLRFRKGKLIYQRSLILVNWFSVQDSFFFSSQISSLSRGFFKSNIFRNIDQRQEYVVNGAHPHMRMDNLHWLVSRL